MMNNPLYNLLGGGANPAQAALGNIQGALQELRTNPVEVLKRAGFSLPAGIESNPQAIIGYLMQSGQINQGRLAQAQQMATKYR